MLGPVGFINKAASAAFKTGGGILYGLVLTGGSDAATLIVYDNTSGTGTVIAKLAAAAGVTVSVSIPNGVTFTTGAYAALTGTAPSASAFYV